LWDWFDKQYQDSDWNSTTKATKQSCQSRLTAATTSDQYNSSAFYFGHDNQTLNSYRLWDWFDKQYQDSDWNSTTTATKQPCQSSQEQR